MISPSSGFWVAKYHRCNQSQCCSQGSPEFGRREYHDGFKLCYEWRGKSFAIPMVFQSLRDAEIAKKSVSEELGECTTIDDVVAGINRIGFGRLREVMTENLKW